MTVSDTLYYITLGNPVSKAVIGTTSALFSKGGGATQTTPTPVTVKASTNAVAAVTSFGQIMPPLWRLAGRHYYFVRLAGLSGASAVILGAIGSHRLSTFQDKGESRLIFDTANRFHFFHALALMAVPLSKHPVLTGTLMVSGTLFFSGVLYIRAFTGNRSYAKAAPIGGMCLIAAWLSMVF